MIKKTLASILVLISVLSQPASAKMEGNEGGHGGDPYSLEFSTLAASLVDELREYEAVNSALFNKHGFSARQLGSAVERVRVVSAEGEGLWLKGREMDAINFPERNEILVNRSRWRESDLQARVKLVFHEYLGILGVERDGFATSIDFQGFTSRIAQKLATNSSKDLFMANLFYGRCISVPALVEKSTCGDDSQKIMQIESCALTQAEGKCRLSGRSQCEIISKTRMPVVSTRSLGLRYCEVLVIMR